MVELSSPGEIRFAEEFTKTYAGDALNTAVAARRLGSEVSFLTGLSDDPFSFGLKQLFLMEGLNTRHVRRFPDGYTGLYFVANDEAGDREFLYYRKHSAASLISPKDIDENVIKSFKLIFSTGVTLGLSQSMRESVYKAFKIARENKIMTVFDPNYRNRLWKNKMEAFDAMEALLPYVDVILPTVPDDTMPTIGLGRPDQVIDFFWFKDVPLVVAKAGEHGCYLGYRKEVQHFPAMKVDRVVDTTGAGDAFNGGFIHGLVTGRSLSDCARLGITAAGLQVQREGTLKSMPSREAVYSRAFSMSSP